MGNIKTSTEYTNDNKFKGQVHSRAFHGGIKFYAATPLNGGTFSTFDQADQFMKKVGYYKLKEAVHTSTLQFIEEYGTSPNDQITLPIGL